jgi:hypothetical protein
MLTLQYVAEALQLLGLDSFIPSLRQAAERARVSHVATDELSALLSRFTLQAEEVNAAGSKEFLALLRRCYGVHLVSTRRAVRFSGLPDTCKTHARHCMRPCFCLESFLIRRILVL